MATRDVAGTIAKLIDPQEPLAVVGIQNLSNLSREDADQLSGVWGQIVLDKRQRMIKDMIEVAEDDIHADFSAVFRIALSDQSAVVRADAIDGLWEDESVSLIRPLLTLLTEDPNEDVRARAAAAMGRFVLLGELGHLSPERTETLIEALIAIINQPSLSLELRRRAVESVAYSSDDRVQGIIQRAYQDTQEKMQVSAVFAMGRSADERWAEIVRHELGSPIAEIRYEAARAAGELEDPHAVQKLILLLHDQDLEVKGSAIWALGQIGGNDAQRALKQVIADPNQSLSEAAKEALAMLQFNAGRFDPSSFAMLPPAKSGPDEDDEDWDEDDEDWDEDDEDWDEDWDEEDWDEDDEDWEDEDDEDLDEDATDDKEAKGHQ